jgi:DEAD/DEAH box helicase
VDQLRDELAESFPPTIGDIEVAADGDLMGLFLMPQIRSIEVMTPERCLALMSHAPEALSDVGLVVFDECHILSPQGGGTRSLDAMLCLLQALKRAPDADFLLLSAMVTNADDLAAWIGEISKKPCFAFQDSWKPSRQARGVVVYPQHDLLEIARSARAAKNSTARGTHRRKDAIPYALFGLHQNWNQQAPADTRIIKLLETSVDLAVNAHGRVTPNANAVSGQLAISAAVAGLKTIIFVQQPSHAVTTARKIADRLTAAIELTNAEELLWSGIQAELGGAEYSLVTPTSAALPHNGDMIPLERRLAEALYRRDNGASIIVATPTLAQGMNLPAQLAILAGDKRHDEVGRATLATHEILNAAGRAGRAGHLANGIVLMIPEPVLAFFGANTPDPQAFDKLRSVLPANDRCVVLEDPITAVLDRIQAGNVADLQVRYFISRVQAAEDPQQAADNVLSMVHRSFSQFLAIRANQQETFELKVEALRSMLIAEGPVEPNVAAVAASHGLASNPLAVIQTRLQATLNQLPTTIIGWTDWLVDFFQSDRASYAALLEQDASTALYVMRGSKTGGPLTGQEFTKLKIALRLWLQGRAYVDIERALGATVQNVKCCPRSRDLILKLTNRRLYLVLSAVAAVANQVYEANGLHAPQPAVLETLAVAVRKGFDTPDKVAYDHIQQTIRSRVMLHAAFSERFAAPLTLQGQPYEVVLDQVSTRLAFSG